MPLRTFTDRQGTAWRVWSVTPEPNAALTLDEGFREGWLCFERMDGGERRRLALTDVPAAWDALPDERLDLLRRVALLTAPLLLDPSTDAIAQPLEDEARARRSGPTTAVGGESDVLV